jgi:hypothetical protein
MRLFVLSRAGDERICGRLPRVRCIDRHATIKLLKLPDYFLNGHDDGERRRSAMRRQWLQAESRTRPGYRLQQKLDSITAAAGT